MAEFFNDVDFQKASYADKMAYVADYAKMSMPKGSSQKDIDDYVNYMQNYTRKEYKWTPKDLEERRVYATTQANKKMANKQIQQSPSFPTIKGKIDYTNPYAETATLSVRPNKKIKAITDYNKFEQERKKTQQDIKKYGSVLTQGKGYMGSGYKPEVQPPTLLESIKSGVENNSITGGILKAMTKQPEDIIRKQYPKELKESLAQRDRTKQVESFYRDASWGDVLQDPNWYAYAASSLAADLPLTIGTGAAGEKLIAKMSTSPEVVNYINKLPVSQRTGKALLDGIRKYAPKALVRGTEGAGYGTGFTALQSPEATPQEYAINAALGGLLGNIPTAIEGISGLSKVSKNIPNVENITKSVTEADDFLNETALKAYQDRLVKEQPISTQIIKPVEDIQNLEQSLLRSAKQAEESIKYKPDTELFDIKPLSDIKSELPKAYNIVNGDEIIFTEPVYGGSFKRPVYKGERVNHVKIIDESYGADKGQHTFSFEVIRSEGKEPLEVGKSYRRKGRNIYKDANLVSEAQDKISLTADKNIRADEAKKNKYMNWFNEGKFDKIPPEELEKIKNGTLFDKESIGTFNTVDNFEVSKQFTDELNNYVKSMAGDNAEITINNDKMFYTNPNTNQSVELSGKAIGNLINISTKQSEADIWKTVDHEVVHVIKNMGGITDDEIKSLADSGLLREIRDRFDIDNRYMEILKSKFGNDYDSIENILNEEALAKAFSEQKYADNPIIRKVMQWIQQFRNYMRGKGFTSEQKLFNEIRSGNRANGGLPSNKEYLSVKTPNEQIYDETGGNSNIIKDVTGFVTDKLNTSYDYIKNGRPLEQWFDKYRPLDNLTRKATPKERMVYYLFSNKQKAAITELETIISGGLKDVDGNDLTRPVKDIVGQIPTKDIEDFKGYTLARLQSEVYAPKFENSRYIEIIKNGTPQELSDLRKYTKMYKDGLSDSIPEKWLDILEEGNRNIGITTEKSVQAINNTAPEKKALYDSVLSELTDFNNKLVKKYLVDTGRISKETFDKWSSKPLYLHVERVMDGTKVGGRKTSAFKNIKGVETGTDNLKDIIDSQMLHWKRVISLGNEQDAWNRFVDTMPHLFRKISGREMMELGGKFATVKNEKIANALTREGRAIVDVLDNDFIDEYSRLFYVDSNDFMNNKNIIKRYGTKDDGTWGVTYYKVNDDIAKMYNYPFDGDALEGFLRWTDKEGGLGRRHYVMENMTNNAVEAMQKLHLDKPAKMVRMGAVTLDSAYSIFGNPVQDVLTAFINSDNPLSVPGSHLILGTLRKMGLLDKEARDLFYKTSVTGASFVENIGENNIQIKALYKFVEGLKALGAFMEDIPRLEEFSYLYRKGLKEGISDKDAIDRAVYGARKITAAFDQSGTIGGKFNNVTAFFNAQLQGIDSFSKTVRNHPVRTVARGAGMISTGALLYYKLMKDSDIYKNASLDSRLHNIFLPLPNTNAYLRIPMRREISALFWTPVMALYETMDGNKHALDEILPTISQAYMPNFKPSAISGFIDISRNRDYKGDKIITPMEEQFRKKEDIYNLNTSDTAIAFSKFYNMVAPEERELSPKEIDYWINSITGGAWKKTNINILKDSMISNLPLAGRYFVDEVDYSRPNSKIERMFTLNEELVKNINPKIKSIDDQIITMNKSGNIDVNKYSELMNRKKVLLSEKIKLEKYTKPALKRYNEYSDIVKKDKIIERIRQGDLTAKQRLIDLNKNLSRKLDIIGEGD